MMMHYFVFKHCGWPLLNKVGYLFFFLFLLQLKVDHLLSKLCYHIFINNLIPVYKSSLFRYLFSFCFFLSSVLNKFWNSGHLISVESTFSDIMSLLCWAVQNSLFFWKTLKEFSMHAACLKPLVFSLVRWDVWPLSLLYGCVSWKITTLSFSSHSFSTLQSFHQSSKYQRNAHEYTNLNVWTISGKQARDSSA